MNELTDEETWKIVKRAFEEWCAYLPDKTLNFARDAEGNYSDERVVQHWADYRANFLSHQAMIKRGSDHDE